MRDTIIMLIDGVISIAAIICTFLNAGGVGDLLITLAPYINTVAIAILAIFNIQDIRGGRWFPKARPIDDFLKGEG